MTDRADWTDRADMIDRAYMADRAQRDHLVGRLTNADADACQLGVLR